MKKLIATKTVISIAILAFLVSCGGGGGSSSSSTTSSSTTSNSYQAGLSIGDFGDLVRDGLSYTLKITSSSYGLEGKTFRGTLTDNGDGSYNIDGNAYAKLFEYDAYSILTFRMVRTDPTFQTYFDSRPELAGVNSVYIPVVALKNDITLKTVDAITSNGASLEFKSVSLATSKVGSNYNYAAEGTRGTIAKISDTQFTVSSCSNNGKTADNANLKTANCTGSLVTTKTYTYDANLNAWNVTPIDSNYPNQKIRAYFVNDVTTNQVIGFVDTSDSTKASSGFRIASVVPANTPVPTVSNTFTLTSYQACTSKDNCADTNGEWGIYYNNSMPPTTSWPIVETKNRSGGRTCIETYTNNNPVNGFTTAITTPGNDACLSSQDRPDTISIVFGLKSVNGKLRGLTADVGYDSTVTGASQKFMLGNIREN